MRISRHFTLSEALRSNTAKRKGISNKPSLNQFSNIVFCAANMDRVRELLGRPIRPSSWLRVEELNRAVGGSKKSKHLEGCAVDFGSEWGDLNRVFNQILASDIPYTKIILEYPEEESSWIHIEFEKSSGKRALVASRSGSGKTVYSNVA